MINKKIIIDILIKELSNENLNMLSGIFRKEYDSKTYFGNDDYSNKWEQFQKDIIEDLLDYLNISTLKELENAQKLGRNKDNQDCGDLIWSWADSRVDIYYQDLHEKSWIFSNYTQNALDNETADGKQLDKTLQAGQFEFWNELGNNIFNSLTLNQ